MHPEDREAASTYGWFAIVHYLSGPLEQLLEQLRSVITRADLPRLHVTALPPRPLSLSVDEACAHARASLAPIDAFEVEVSELGLFQQSGLFFLDIAAGSEVLHGIHDAASAGPLAFVEEFDYRPHVTLGGPARGGSISHIQERLETDWRKYEGPRQFTLDSFVCLWCKPGHEVGDWIQYSTFHLARRGKKAASPGGRFR